MTDSIVERVVEGSSPAWLFAEHVARYRFASKFVDRSRVLDIACGSGYGTALLKGAGAGEVVGVDLDPQAVEYARSRYGGPGVTFLEGDAASPPVSGPFDTIVSFETIEHLEDPAGFCRACNDRLQPGGIFIVSTPWRTAADGKPKNPFHLQEWRPEEFRRLLQPFFREIALYGQSVALLKRPFQLSRKMARPLARLRGFELNDPEHIFELPGPRFPGLWTAYPATILAVGRGSRSHRSDQPMRS
jgi:SAM-dependent methyltransferase